ncbi:MAG: hypothetical protein QGG54_11370 [Gammaproteobacteria bacterium]|jgi:hypothetical protein|nr:hypothetical protein [Gammaproteobacteria bacterium]MDP6535949.1 hypothetical protein [Gammaproteobacteria bacterium]MDP6734285.1 hypothetical protein [Gammaproteobacteria bacterium]HAJ76741.1 hypothetical protein [Gammaproteobacteria bacterium]|tara:strand:+ start:1464 stop:2240 length:777 start_codon:yes stop_codon:yes gene_type:complete
MNNYKLLVQAFCYSLVLAACAQTVGPDYRNEVGANGLLTPRAVLTRYVDALGGERVIRSHTSTTMRGRFLLTAFGMEGDATIYSRAPNHVSQLIELPGLGSFESGYNGDVGWSVDPFQGSSVLEGDALVDLVQQSDYYLPLSLALSPGQETEELTDLNGAEAYKVKLTDDRGKNSYLYFAADSGLLVHSEVVVSSPAGEVPTTTYLDNYQDFGGYLQPTRITINSAGQEFSIEVDEVTFDDVTDEQFVVPNVIRGQLR